jgi:hypothetical protein
MDHKFDKNAMEKARQLVNSDAGRQLAGKLQQLDPRTMQQVQSQFASGDFSQLSKTLGPLLESDEVKKLLQQLGG